MDRHKMVRRGALLWVAIANAAAAIGFAILLFVVPIFSRVDTYARFTQLDRAGVINAPALAQFHPSYGFGNIAALEYRSTVPDYIAAAPLAAQRTNALLGLLLALANAIGWAVAWRKLRPSQKM